ncbi:transposase [Acinetobacter sp. B5B]|uniref:RNA-guided endonuclease TnpB family protein n=1 Tax=Acinetobacter baretiae TaxID=2605383 RepID=UPI0018C248C6|nr:RNA-guided endonuclease TnpB family protein [Acinetobacter baretiae]MBF7681844.1 transposase [Acinetobacter baretiae]
MSETIYKAVKCRIHPNKTQQVLIQQHFGCARFVYNWALALQNRYYKFFKKSISRTHLQSQLVKKKDHPKYVWLKAVNSQALLSSLLHVHTAFSNFFKGRAKFPRLKSKKISQRAYQCPQHCTLDTDSQRLNVPKIKGIKAKITQDIQDKIKTVTIIQSATGKYYASVLVETSEHVPKPTMVDASQTIGIDLGLECFLIQSDGVKIENPRYFQRSQTRLAISQKIFSRKKKTSKNYQRQKRLVASRYEKVRHQRLNQHHQLTHRLIRENQATSYAVEDLGIKNMVKNAKLAKAISDVGWGQFLTLLKYKAKWNGKNILEIGRFVPSSKVCSHCGYTCDQMPLHIRTWTCQDCDSIHDRDINASINIRNFALIDAPGRGVV